MEWLVKTGGLKDQLKMHMNTQHESLLPSSDPNTLILTLIPPPPLHLILLGPCNLLMEELVKHYPGIHDVLKELHIISSNYHGNKFEGTRNLAHYARLIIAPAGRRWNGALSH